MKSKINSTYRVNNTQRVLQGDILTNIDIPIYDDELHLINMEYGVVLSQDCDLNQDYTSRKEITDISNDQDNLSLNNKMIPSILICPAYLAEQLRKGTHLKSLNQPMVKISHSKKDSIEKNYSK